MIWNKAGFWVYFRKSTENKITVAFCRFQIYTDSSRECDHLWQFFGNWSSSVNSIRKVQKHKVLSEPHGFIGGTDLQFHSPQPDNSYAVRLWISASASHFMPVYAPAFTGIHCAYAWRSSQDELIWVAGYIPRWFASLRFAHPSTNCAKCTVTSLIETNTQHATTNSILNSLLGIGRFTQPPHHSPSHIWS